MGGPNWTRFEPPHVVRSEPPHVLRKEILAQASTALTVTGTFPCVALEYGQSW